MRDHQGRAAQAGAEPEHHNAREFSRPLSHGRAAELHETRRHVPARPAAKPRRGPTPDRVLQAFNTWSFKREQPDTPDRLRQAIAQASALEQPLPFVLYWGKGPRERLESPDLDCLDFLAALGARVGAVYPPGAAFRVIFTDTHAALNGHARESCENYFGAVDAAAGARGFSSCRLGDLVAAHGGRNDPFPDEPPSEELLEKLSLSAAKWYGGAAREGAERYYRMNQREKRAVGAAFPHSIFVTFNGSEFRALFPDSLPIFYMYSLRRGVSVKPWFLSATGEPGVPAE